MSSLRSILGIWDAAKRKPRRFVMRRSRSFIVHRPAHRHVTSAPRMVLEPAIGEHLIRGCGCNGRDFVYSCALGFLEHTEQERGADRRSLRLLAQPKRAELLAVECRAGDRFDLLLHRDEPHFALVIP